MVHARSLELTARRRVTGLVRSGGIALIDQGTISLSNFLTSVIVARSLDLHGFGLFTLALTLLFAGNALQGALVTGPLNVLIAGRDQDGRRRFITTIGTIQLGLIVVLEGVALLGFVMSDAELAPVALAVAVAILGWQTQEFGRRVLYVEERYADALANDFLSYGGQVAACAILAAGGGMTTVTALLGVGCTSFAAGVLALIAVRHRLGVTPSLADARLSLHHGVWLAAGEVAQFISARLPAFLVAAFVAVSASGILGAALLLLNPLNVVVFSLWSVVPMRLAKIRAEQGEEAAGRMFRHIQLVTTPPVVAFCVFAAVLGEILLDVLYGNQYSGYGWLVGILAVFSIVRFHSGLVIAGLWSRRMSRSIFTGHVVGAVVAIVAGVSLVATFGLAGAGLAMIVATTISTIVWWIAYLRGTGDAVPDSSTPATPAAGPPA